jgi:hypothetical protein
MNINLDLVKAFTTIIFFTSCNSQIKSESVSISGKLFSSKSKTVYLNKIDHFDYLDDQYTIDSTTVSENGEFKFNAQNLNSQLVSLTTEKFKPYTYQIYSAAPQTYFFGNCEKFFTNIPTFYITDEQSISIDWYEYKEIDSISSPNKSGQRQVNLRDFYLTKNKIDKSDLNYDTKQDFKSTWEQMQIERGFDLKKVNLENIDVEYSFDNYLYTETYLGHLNQFLNWFEEYFQENIESSLHNIESDSFYSSIFLEYNKHRWNPKSLEYYKFTERFVNHHMNIESKSFEHYYIPTIEKRKLAERILKGVNRERYLTLIDKQIDNASIQGKD